MKKALYILTILLLLPACGQKQKDNAHRTETGPPPQKKDGLKIEVSTDKGIYQIGEKIVITVSVKNVGSVPVKYPPLDGWSPTKPDRLDALQLRYFGAGFFRGNPDVSGYKRRGYVYAYGPRQSFSAKPETLNPGEERSVTFDKETISAGPFRVEANFFIANKYYLRVITPPGAKDSRDVFASPRQTVEIPDGWTGLIRATKTVTIGETAVDVMAKYVRERVSALRHDHPRHRHKTMEGIAEHYPYCGRSLLLGAFNDSQIVRSRGDRKALVRALAHSLRKCYARDVLEKLFEISMDSNEKPEVRLEALEAYYLLTPKYLVREGFVLQPEQDMANQFAANVSQLKQSTVERIKDKAEDIEKWSQDKTRIDP